MSVRHGKTNNLAVAGMLLALIGLAFTLISIPTYISWFSLKSEPLATSDKDVDRQATAADESNFRVRSFYERVTSGQSRAHVVKQANKQPDTCNKNHAEGYGEIEYCSWYGAGSDRYATVTVTFVNGVVDGKTKINF